MTVAAPRLAPRRMARGGLGRTAARTAQGLVGVLAACALWELTRALGLVDPRDLPGLGAIWAALVNGLVGGALVAELLATLLAWFLGLLVATVLGTIVGVALGLSPRADTLTRPIVEFLRPIPSVALIPIALVVMGLGLDMEIALIAFASIWPILFSVKAGVEDTDPRYLDAGRTMRLNQLERTWRIVLPDALPALATGIRTSAAIALVLAITVELVTGQPGIGAYLSNQRLAGQVADVWAAVFLTGALGYLINVAFLLLERRLVSWSPEHRKGQR